MLDLTAGHSAAEAADYYSRQANELLDRYEGVSFETVHADLLRHIPVVAGAALDIGAGSGRDAAWLASHGWTIVAVEPSAALREGGRRLHPDGRIRWVDDCLPDLAKTRGLKRKFDLILLSAVWMHVAPEAEEIALTALAGLCAPGCIVSISVRMGGDENRRGFYPTDLSQLKERARRNHFEIIAEDLSPDRLGRAGVVWTGLVLKRY
jgi:2-polyprenyl-3-methyl-5-hydroxy-6-metoxy-1,4-benzoquinol methylase